MPIATNPSGPIPLATVRVGAMACHRCSLEATRQNVVFGDGDSNARLMIVGEAPGADEDRLGRPFQGAAGRTLDALLAEVGLDRSDVYIANVVMCRPPANRPPRQAWVASCAPHLDAQVASVRPTVTLALGATAIRRMLGSKTTVCAARGRIHETALGAVVATYHPSPVSLNRDPRRGVAIRDDLWLAMTRLGA